MELDLEIPLETFSAIEDQEKREPIENTYLLESTVASHLRDGLLPESDSSEVLTAETTIDRSLLTWVQSAVKSSDFDKALDVTKLIITLQALKSAVKIAEFYDLDELKEKIEELVESKEGLNEEKRESKWGKLEDRRTWTSSDLGKTDAFDKGKSSRAARDELSKPFTDEVGRRRARKPIFQENFTSERDAEEEIYYQNHGADEPEASFNGATAPLSEGGVYQDEPQNPQRSNFSEGWSESQRSSTANTSRIWFSYIFDRVRN
jgi:hypothetical protein